MSLPGSKPWSASLLGFAQIGDYGVSSGVIEFEDGTIWSYDDHTPAWGDGEWWNAEADWIGILERKPGSDFWESLTPDAWGMPDNSQVLGYPNWPSPWSNVADADMSGDLSVAPVTFRALWDHGWTHVLDPDNPDVVWFYSWDFKNLTGPISVNKKTRRWTRYFTSDNQYWMGEDVVGGGLYGSNQLVIHKGYFYWLINSHTNWAWEGNATGIRLVRAPVTDPADVTILHEWGNEGGFRGDYPTWKNDHWGMSEWQVGVDTANIDLFEYIDNQNFPPGNYGIAIDDDDYVYFFTEYDSRLSDSRTIREYKNPDAVSYDKKYCFLRRFKIGDYKLETVMWHTMNPDWVGFGSADGWGTMQDDTVGVTTDSNGTRHDTYSFPAVGMGLNGVVRAIHGGWLYWFDASWGINGGGGADGTPGSMLCRMKLSEMNPEKPIHHDIMSPAFEIVTQGGAPWEATFAAHYGSDGSHIGVRGGGRPILPGTEPWSGGLSFSEDGSILYKGFMYPPYFSYHGGIDWYLFGVQSIWKLTSYTDKWSTEVTVTFTGDELRGYANVREVPIRPRGLEVDLS